VLAHEQRNLFNTPMLAFDSIKSGRVPVGGSTASPRATAALGYALDRWVHRR
jgi:hypothetical protein